MKTTYMWPSLGQNVFCMSLGLKKEGCPGEMKKREKYPDF